MLNGFIQRNRTILLYGVAMAGIIFILQCLEYRLVLLSHAYEVYIFCIAVIFTLLGIWIAGRLIKRKVVTKVEIVTVEKEVAVTPDKILNAEQASSLNLSNRELEVLSLMAEGLSNQQIADRLFLSLSTVKTHSTRLFEKMDVERRTQAIEKARRLQIIA